MYTKPTHNAVEAKVQKVFWDSTRLKVSLLTKKLLEESKKYCSIKLLKEKCIFSLFFTRFCVNLLTKLFTVIKAAFKTFL